MTFIPVPVKMNGVGFYEIRKTYGDVELFKKYIHQLKAIYEESGLVSKYFYCDRQPWKISERVNIFTYLENATRISLKYSYVESELYNVTVNCSIDKLIHKTVMEAVLFYRVVMRKFYLNKRRTG